MQELPAIYDRSEWKVCNIERLHVKRDGEDKCGQKSRANVAKHLYKTTSVQPIWCERSLGREARSKQREHLSNVTSALLVKQAERKERVCWGCIRKTFYLLQWRCSFQVPLLQILTHVIAMQLFRHEMPMSLHWSATIVSISWKRSWKWGSISHPLQDIVVQGTCLLWARLRKMGEAYKLAKPRGRRYGHGEGQGWPTPQSGEHLQFDKMREAAKVIP